MKQHRLLLLGAVAAGLLSACSLVLGIGDLPGESGGAGDASSGDASSEGGPNDGGFEDVVPIHAPSAVAFVDQDPTQGNISGRIDVVKATDESDVAAYHVYTSVDGKTKGPLLTTLAKTGSNLSFDLDAGLDAGFVLAFTANAAGEMATGVSGSVGDNYPFTGSAWGGDPDSGETAQSPSIAIDSINDKIVILAVGAASDILMSRCNLDGSQCAVPTSLGASTGSPKAMIDTANQKLVFIAGPYLWRCNLDGTSCSHIANGLGNTSSSHVGAIDTTHGIVVAVDTIGEAATCDLATFTCTQAPNIPQLTEQDVLEAAIDPTTNTLWVAAMSAAAGTEGPPLVSHCALPLAVGIAAPTTCESLSISGSFNYSAPSITLDPRNGYAIPAYQSPDAGLYRCPYGGGVCSPGYPILDRYPIVRFDDNDQKVLIATQSSSPDSGIRAYRCTDDVTSCTFVSLSDRLTPEADPSATIDVVNRRFWIVATVNAKPTLYSIGTW